MNFQIGQKVACVDNKSRYLDSITASLKIGYTYSVKSVRYCCKCGKQCINVGLPIIGKWAKEIGVCSCGNIDKTYSNEGYHMSSRFVPLEEYEASEKMVEKLLEPIKEKI